MQHRFIKLKGKKNTNSGEIQHGLSQTRSRELRHFEGSQGREEGPWWTPRRSLAHDGWDCAVRVPVTERWVLRAEEPGLGHARAAQHGSRSRLCHPALCPRGPCPGRADKGHQSGEPPPQVLYGLTCFLGADPSLLAASPAAHSLILDLLKASACSPSLPGQSHCVPSTLRDSVFKPTSLLSFGSLTCFLK